MSNIAENKKAFHDYKVEDRYTAGMVLQGWEIKAIRAGRVQMTNAYVYVRDGEVFLVGSHIAPLTNSNIQFGASDQNATRSRKLLLNGSEIKKLIGKVSTSGYTIVPINLHFSKGRVKCEIGLAKGKKQHDKRADEKDKDAKREVARAMKSKEI